MNFLIWPEETVAERNALRRGSCTTEIALAYFRFEGRPRSATNGYPAVTVQRRAALIP